MTVLDFIVEYVFPTVALVLSALSFRDSRGITPLQARILEIEEKLKIYELEEKQRQREAAMEACIEARVVNISKRAYRLKIWNSGKATAFNVDFTVAEEISVLREKVPYEVLEPGKSFEEHIIVQFGTPRKFSITTTWTDSSGKPHSKEQIVSF
jgi:hypothetical protein